MLQNVRPQRLLYIEGDTYQSNIYTFDANIDYFMCIKNDGVQ